MKTMIGRIFLIAAVTLAIGKLSVAAAGWDETFHSSFTNNVILSEAERINAITTLGTDVYFGTSLGILWRYKETDGSWVQLAHTDGAGGPIYALSAVQDGNGVKWLFVGGSFSSVIFGAQSSAAHNVVALNLNSGAISKLGNSTIYGTDGPVHALKAVPWLDYNPQYPPQLYGVRCLVGGSFSAVAGVLGPCKSIAQWSQGIYTYGGWNGFSGGLDDPILGFGSIVRGLEGTTTNALISSPYGYKLRTDWDGIWMTGHFLRNVGSKTNRNIAKVAGSGSTWVYLGQGYLRGGCLEDEVGIEPYPSMFGKTVCGAGTNIYFGGFGSGHFRADDTVLYCGSCDPNDPFGYMSLLTVGKQSTSIAGSCLRNVEALAAMGNDIYAAGNLWLDSNNDDVMFGKLSGGTWTSITIPTDHGLFSNDATSAATTANYVYFAGSLCWRYIP